MNDDVNDEIYRRQLAAWRGYYVQQLAWEQGWSLEQAEESIADRSTEELLEEKAPGLLSRFEELAAGEAD